MKVLVGARGGTGRLIVRDALAKGHSVAVLVRSKARALDHPGVAMTIESLESLSLALP
jgi:putative NADH-flavin reductase